MSDPEKKPCCSAPRSAPAQASADVDFKRINAGSTGGMVLIPGGTYQLGSDDKIGYAADGEGPILDVTVDSFYMDRTPVTNQAFAAFIKATNYKTEADEFGWSFVFHSHVPKKVVGEPVPGLQWWRKVDRANWRRPEGPGSNVKKRKDYPVVHVSYSDALAYCDWAGKRLPTEAEWEVAGRGGLVQNRYVWGNEFMPNGKHQCNIFQGTFPSVDTADDGYAGTCPVKAFPANGYGTYSMAGNVWEWCRDWFDPIYRRTDTRENPIGPRLGDRRVMRGGSFLCHDSYCNRYRVAARTSNTPDSTAANLGFRCVRDV